MPVSLPEIESLKDTAKLYRDFGDFPAALKPLDEGIKLLRHRLKSPEIAASKTGETIEEINKTIADLLGMKGGIYRRAAAAKAAGRDGNLKKAEEMYLAGAKLERNDSYNLTNSIVIPLIRAPQDLPSLQGKIVEAIAVVQGQEDKRRNQWWYWADLALLNLLADNQEKALTAYEQYSRAGARVKDFDSTISVLRDFLTAWPSGDVNDRLTRAISFLESEKAKLQ